MMPISYPHNDKIKEAIIHFQNFETKKVFGELKLNLKTDTQEKIIFIATGHNSL